VKPDIVTMAKGITSGYFPLSVTAVRREIYESFAGDSEYERLRHVNTFGGHPAACAAAIKNLEIMEEEDLPGRSARMGEELSQKLSGLEGHPNVGEIRNKGLLLGIEMVEDKQSKQPASSEKVNAVVAACKTRGLIVGKNADTVAGFDNSITLAPPLSLTDEDLEFAVQALSESITDPQVGHRKDNRGQVS
jgi:taurine-pyruvate aminotransferase